VEGDGIIVKVSSFKAHLYKSYNSLGVSLFWLFLSPFVASNGMLTMICIIFFFVQIVVWIILASMYLLFCICIFESFSLVRIYLCS